MSASNLYSIPPNPETMVLPPGFTALPPRGEDMILPDGYVYGTDREYPLPPKSNTKKLDIFREFSGSFIEPFHLEAEVASIDSNMAANASRLLSIGDYTLMHAFFIGERDKGIDGLEGLNVSEVLSLDFDMTPERIKRYIDQGAIVGPCFVEIDQQIDGDDSSPFRPSGVGLWTKSKLHR